MKPYPLTFQPVFKERIWGGSKLQQWFADCPRSKLIGEAWVLSDHPHGETMVANGLYAERSLHALMALEPAWFKGLRQGRFPVLIKVLDAAKDLSIQVHPDDVYGLAHGGESGKTECWFVLEAETRAKLIYGHSAEDRIRFEQGIAQNQLEDLLHVVHPEAGEFYYVPAGKLHALGQGLMVMEIQQNSDTTYRVYDYGRRDEAGQLRELHVEHALEVISFPDQPVQTQNREMTRDGVTVQRLLESPYFTVDQFEAADPQVFNSQGLTILSVVSGRGRLTGGREGVDLYPGQQVLLPADMGECIISGQVTLLVTTPT